MQCECIYEAGKVVTLIFVIYYCYWVSIMILDKIVILTDQFTLKCFMFKKEMGISKNKKTNKETSMEINNDDNKINSYGFINAILLYTCTVV